MDYVLLEEVLVHAGCIFKSINREEREYTLRLEDEDIYLKVYEDRKTWSRQDTESFDTDGRKTLLVIPHGDIKCTGKDHLFVTRRVSLPPVIPCPHDIEASILQPVEHSLMRATHEYVAVRPDGVLNRIEPLAPPASHSFPEYTKYIPNFYLTPIDTPKVQALFPYTHKNCHIKCVEDVATHIVNLFKPKVELRYFPELDDERCLTLADHVAGLSGNSETWHAVYSSFIAGCVKEIVQVPYPQLKRDIDHCLPGILHKRKMTFLEIVEQCKECKRQLDVMTAPLTRKRLLHHVLDFSRQQSLDAIKKQRCYEENKRSEEEAKRQDICLLATKGRGKIIFDQEQITDDDRDLMRDLAADPQYPLSKIQTLDFLKRHKSALREAFRAKMGYSIKLWSEPKILAALILTLRRNFEEEARSAALQYHSQTIKDGVF